RAGEPDHAPVERRRDACRVSGEDRRLCEQQHLMEPIAVIGAPSAIGISPYRDGGMRRLDLAPTALREQGLIGQLGARDLGDVIPPPGYADVEKPAGRVRNE